MVEVREKYLAGNTFVVPDILLNDGNHRRGDLFLFRSMCICSFECSEFVIGEE